MEKNPAPLRTISPLPDTIAPAARAVRRPLLTFNRADAVLRVTVAAETVLVLVPLPMFSAELVPPTVRVLALVKAPPLFRLKLFPVAPALLLMVRFRLPAVALVKFHAADAPVTVTELLLLPLFPAITTLPVVFTTPALLTVTAFPVAPAEFAMSIPAKL